jgi:uncharacterized RDD family membrane protein YckC
MADHTESAEVKTVHLGGFGLRLAAFVIDTVFVWFVGMILGVAVGLLGYLLTMYTADGPAPIDRLIIVTGLIFSVAYYLYGWTKSGQTMGKMVLGIKIVGADGQPPSGGRAVLRYLGYILNAILLSLGFLWAAFDRKRQGLHDKIAGTYVVYVDDKFTDVTEVNLEPADSSIPKWVWIVLWIVLLVTAPVVLASTVLGLGPYVAQLLVNMVGGGG